MLTREIYSFRFMTEVFLTAGLVIVSTNVTAQTTCPSSNRIEAVELQRKARAWMDIEKYDKAFENLQSAHSICAEPERRYEIGIVLEKAGRLREALDSFKACVSEARNRDLRERCELKALAIEDRLANGIIRVTMDPLGAMMYFDDEDEGHPTDRPIKISAGSHKIEIRLKGYRPFSTVVKVPGGEEISLGDVRLEPDLPPSPIKPEAIWNWVGIGLGVALVGTGAGFLGQHIQDVTDRVNGQSLGNANLIAGCVVAPVGLAVIITSAVLWPEASVAVSAAPVKGGGMAAVSVVF